MFTLLERQTASLRQFHPKATMWLSPQGFTLDWMNQFYDLMAKQPAWLTGLVFGPQVRARCRRCARRSTSATRFADTPTSPTACARSPVPDWDIAHAQTSNREPINPRPLDETAIYRALDEHAIGFITYSEGCNDDVNKIVWSNLGWDRNADPWRRCASTPLLHRRPLHRQLRTGAAVARAQLARPARQQRGRGYDVAAVPGHGARRRSSRPAQLALPAGALPRVHDAQSVSACSTSALEVDAMTALSRGRATGALAALDAADAALARATTVRRQRRFANASASLPGLFQSIRMQLAVKPWRDCRRPRRDARHGGHAAQRSRLAGRALQGDPRPRQGGRAACGDRHDPALD